jgi:hypothetical protein
MLRIKNLDFRIDKLLCSHLEMDHIYIASIMAVKIFYENTKFNESLLVSTGDSN